MALEAHKRLRDPVKEGGDVPDRCAYGTCHHQPTVPERETWGKWTALAVISTLVQAARDG